MLGIFISFLCVFGQTVFSQTGSYSPLAQKELDDYSVGNPNNPDNLDVFKFSIKEILDSNNAVMQGPNNEPLIYGKTDFGSEFTLYNDLNASLKIEIPSFVIDVLAEDTDGEYYPVIINGNDDLIDFKDQYDTVNGQFVAPEKGFVKLIEGDSGQYSNLEDGDIVEFFVRPTAIYSASHNADTLFYIDRPIPSSETDTGNATNDTGTSTTTTTERNDTGSETVVPSSSEGSAEPTTEGMNYVTTVYVSAPASNFNPTTIVVPVHADGDYVAGITPGPAESFPSNIEVVAITPEEASRIIKKAQELEKAKAEARKYVRKNERPVLDDELKPAKNLNKSMISIQNARGIIIQNSKKIVSEEFPRLSKEFINFLFNDQDRKTRFEIISDPTNYLKDEFAKLDELLSRETSSSANFTPRQLVKFNYLLDHKFADELAAAGLVENRTEINFLNKPANLAGLLKKQSLRDELLPIISILGPRLSEENKNEFMESHNNSEKYGSSALFEKKSSKDTINKIKIFSSLIDELNDRSFISSQSQVDPPNDNLPLVEINVKSDQNIKEVLENKMKTTKALNRPYKTKSFKETMGKFDFEILEENIPANIDETFPVALDPIEIPDKQLELMAEATEAADTLLNETLDKMLEEIGSQTPRVENSSLFSNATDITNQDKITNLLQVVHDRTKAVEDIRAIFQTMGFGS